MQQYKGYTYTPVPKTAWDNLSLAAKAEMMKVAVRHGITTLQDIKDKYNEFAEGGDTNPGMTGMMKSKLAIAAHFGNPTARRMTNYDTRSYTWPGEYEYDNGIGEPKRGNVFVSSYGNLVTPQIQDTGKELTFIEDVWSPENDRRSFMQSLKFNNEEDARYFGEHYKEIAPMMNLYRDGGHKIHIKPENRGKFTALKERTGHSATWFKEHGTPAQKKMATFALNARKWKHGLGGNLFYPGGDITYGHPYYSYDENGQLIKDENGNPILNYNATLPELEVIGTNRNYPLKAKQERARQREIAKNYFASTPTPSNIYKGIEALVNSSPLVTTAATVNPNMVYGIAPTDAAFTGNPLNSTTSNFLKWLGRPTNYRPKNPLSTAPFEKLSYEIKGGSQELKYPGLAKMMDLWERKGVDLSKIGIEDLDDIYRLRKANYTNGAPSRYTIANQTGSNYELIDYDNGTPVGKIDLLIDDSNYLFMSNIRNLTNKYPNGDPRKVHDVQRRGLNSAIAVAKSEGKEGVISGNYLQSAPKQYSAIFEHPERTVVSKKGLHTNENMVSPGEYGMFGGWEGPAEASSVEEMWANGDKKAMQLQNAPVWKLTEQSFFTPTKSDVFDPTIIDEAGKMHTDWNLLDIFKGISIPIIGFNAIKNQKKKRNERM